MPCLGCRELGTLVKYLFIAQVKGVTSSQTEEDQKDGSLKDRAVRRKGLAKKEGG